MENKEMNIFQKMSLITDEINRVAKNLNVGVGKSSYKAVGEADVLSAVKPIEIKYGVYSYPIKRDVIKDNELVSNVEFKDFNTGEISNKEKLTVFMRIKTTYRFVNTDKPTEYIDIDTFGDGVDTQDKAPGKAMTYADKYALLKAYKIETGEDPDQNISGNIYKGAISKPAVNKPVVKQEPVNDEIKQTTLKNAGDFIFPFGKNKGKSIKQIYEEDKKEEKDYGYLDWCLDADFVKQDIKDLIAQFLEDINTGYDINLEEVEIETEELPF